MSPIRIALIGLSAGGSWASNAHWPYLKDSKKYTVVGLCNSSPEAAEAAKKKYNLPASTKTYASPDEVAADPDVDLVVCSTRVDRHYEHIRPSVAAGKNCYVEWPLGGNLQQAEELNALAKEKGGHMMVGLQARRSPVVNTVKELVESGRIGRVLSCTVVSTAGNFGPSENLAVKYFLDRKVGGNMVTIHFGHLIDYVLYALGELGNYTSLLDIQRPQSTLKNPDGSVAETVTRTSHDQIMLQGHLKSGAVLSIHQRGGSPFKDQPGLVWRIYGDKGEIMVTSDGSFLQVGYPNMDIKVHDLATDKVESIDWKKGADIFEDLPLPARNVARLYEAYADKRTDCYADWELAVRRHKLIDDSYRKYDQSK